MQSHADSACLERAARPARERIQVDMDRVSPRLSPLLGYIQSKLFDRQLSVEQACRECGIRDHGTLTLFHEEVGKPPYGYIIDCRMQTAAQLLSTTDMKIWQVANLIGYSTLPAFSDAFLRWSGQRPRAYRNSCPSPVSRKASPDEVRASLVQCLVEGDGGRRKGAPSGLPVMVDGLAFEATAAAEIWKRLRKAPEERQLQAVSGLVEFRSPALFQLLCEESRAVSRKNPREGVRLSQLALASLGGLSQASEENRELLRAKALTWLGNAYRVALDPLRSGRALSEAKRVLGGDRALAEGKEALELLQYEAALRIDQRRYDDAQALADKALAISKKHFSRERAFVQSALLRATILARRDENQEAIRELMAVYALVAESEEKYFSLAVSVDLAITHLALGEPRAAERFYREANALAADLDLPRVNVQMRWVRALLEDGQGKPEEALRSFQSARLGFAELEEVGYTAAVSLDLAIFYSRQGETAAAGQLASEILPILEALRFYPDVTVSIELVRQAIAEGSLNSALLGRLKSCSQDLLGLSKRPALVPPES